MLKFITAAWRRHHDDCAVPVTALFTLQPFPTASVYKYMNAIAETSAEHAALLNEYRIALRLWTETRALYQQDAAPEVLEANRMVESLEHRLRDFRRAMSR